MNKINIDLDDNLVNFMKEECGRDITDDITTIVKTALKEKNIETVSEGIDRKRHVVVKYKRY